MTPATGRRLLLVHAHPDDEAIPTGVTIARYAAEGVHVTLVTCTLGEVGEIVADDLQHLADADGLGAHRLGELRDACDVLGVHDLRVLGGAGRWRDSGMMGEPTNDDPRAFWQADVPTAAEDLVRTLREVRPQVVVTYDERGDYGHPDHIQAHRVTMAAVEAAADASVLPDAGPPWHVAKVYWNATPKSVLKLGMELAAAVGADFFGGAETVDDLPFGVADELVTTRISAPERAPQKLDALRRHRSQVAADGPFFVLPEEHVGVFWGVEHFRLVRGERGPVDPATGWEDDLFAGLPSDT